MDKDRKQELKRAFKNQRGRQHKARCSWMTIGLASFSISSTNAYLKLDAITPLA